MAGLSKQFWSTTRGQVVGLLRRGARTVEELASALRLTDNAVRAHLATLERDGFVRQEGVRRGGGAGKPAALYELAPDAEVRLSRAYAPVLAALLEELTAHLSADQVDALMLSVGRRLAGAVPRPVGSQEGRVRAAVGLLNELGGEVRMESNNGSGFVVRGCGCPLSAAVAARPETCRAVQALLSEIIGTPVTMCCEHGPRPQCCFSVPPAA